MRLSLLVFSVVITVAFGGCSAKTAGAIKRQAAIDLSCSEGQVRVSAINKRQGQYLAEACQRRAVYSSTKSNGVVRLSDIEGPGTTSALGAPVVMPPPSANDTPPPPPPPPLPPPAP